MGVGFQFIWFALTSVSNLRANSLCNSKAKLEATKDRYIDLGCDLSVALSCNAG
jgi:hypothetical protein